MGWVERAAATLGIEVTGMSWREGMELLQHTEERLWSMRSGIMLQAASRPITEGELALFETARQTVYRTDNAVRSALLRLGVPASLLPVPTKVPELPLRVRQNAVSGLGRAVPIERTWELRRNHPEVAGTFGTSELNYLPVYLAFGAIVLLILDYWVVTGSLFALLYPDLERQIHISDNQVAAAESAVEARRTHNETIRETIAAGGTLADIPPPPETPSPAQVGGAPPDAYMPWFIKAGLGVALIGGLAYGVYVVSTAGRGGRLLTKVLS